MKKYNNTVLFALLMMTPVLGIAQEAAADPRIALVSNIGGWVAIAAGLAIGLAAIGGTLAQGKAAAAALDGMARNPSAAGKVLVPMILSLAFIESLVIFSFMNSNSLKGLIENTLLTLGQYSRIVLILYI